MKLTTGILGCALAAGLMTVASDKTQAGGVVIGNELYTTFNLKLTASYANNNSIKKTSVTSKQVLSDAGFSGKVSLATGPGTGENQFDVYVINNQGKNSTIIADLSTNGILVANATSLVSTTKGNDSGTLEVVYYSDGGEFGTDSADWFDISGVYTSKSTDSKVNNKGQFTRKENFSAKQMSGSGAFADSDKVGSSGEVPVTGSVSGSGSGKLTAPL